MFIQDKYFIYNLYNKYIYILCITILSKNVYNRKHPVRKWSYSTYLFAE